MHLSPVSFEQCAHCECSMCTTLRRTVNIEESESIRGSFSSTVEAEEENYESENDNYDDDDDDDNDEDDDDDLMVYDDPCGHPGDH